MKHSKTVGVLVLAIACLAFAFSTWGQTPEPGNPVQREMRLLRDAMRASVDAIAAGDVRHLPKQLHAVHMAADDTTSALESGEYKPPFAGDRLEAFLALDEEFHRHLIKMAKAAKRNDVAATAEHFGALMNRCHGCHSQFGVQPIARD